MTKVLIVEADEMLVTVTSATLHMAGFKDFVVARNCPEGIALWRTGRPDLVLLDEMFFGTNGDEVLEAIRSDPNAAGTRIIMLTTLAQRADGHRITEPGDVTYLTKPFSPRDLLASVRETMATA